MRYVYFGGPEFAAIVLEKLVSANLAPIAVVTNPDRPAGRDQKITPPPLKKFIRDRKWKIEVLQPEKIDNALAQKLENIKADVFVVAAYGKIMPQWLIEMPPYGTIGIHPSLLPKYRGATPIQSAIISGEKITGTTVFKLDEKMDHGDLLAQEEIKIGDENYRELSQKLAKLSGNLLAKTLPKYLSKEVAPRPQNHSLASYTKKFKLEDAFIDNEALEEAQGETAVLIWQKIRALNPEPGTFTIKNKKRLKLLEADLVDNKLVLKKIQWEGKSPVTLKA